MTLSRTVLRARRAIVDGHEQPAAVVLEGPRIVAVLPADMPVAGVEEVVLADDEVLLPGLVDSHVHVNEPGRTEWEGFATATRAAAAGGITTIVDMPLNSLPPTVDVSALEVKRKAATGQCTVDVAFWGGAIPGNLGELRGLHDAGVVGFKCFMVDSGVPEFPPLLDPTAALREIASFEGVLIAHAEDGELLTEAHGRRYADFVASRPGAAEDSAIARLLDAARVTGARVHVVHLSSAAALPLLAEARADGMPVTVETCPHYLALTAEEVPDGDTRFKCCPPVREAANREALVAGPRRRRDRHGGERPLAVHPGAQAARLGRLRRGVGRHRVLADHVARRLGAGPRARPRARRRGAVDGDSARSAGRARRQGTHRRRGCRRSGGVRPGRDLRGRHPAPPQPAHPVLGPHAPGGGAPDLAGRPAGGRRGPRPTAGAHVTELARAPFSAAPPVAVPTSVSEETP